MSQDSSGVKGTRLEVGRNGDTGFDFRQGLEIILFFTTSSLAQEATHPSLPWLYGALSVARKHPEPGGGCLFEVS
jgi:hypothetical protein